MDFLISPLGWKNWLLLIAALINLSMAIFIFSRGIKNKVNLYFSLLTFFCFLWSFSIFGQIVLQSIFWAKFSFQTSFVGALGIALFLFYFIVYFPFQSVNLKMSWNYLLWVITILFGILSYTRWNLVSFDKDSANQLILGYYVVFQYFYALFFVFLVFIAMCLLWSKAKKVENFLKKDMIFLFWMLLIGLCLGIYFNLFLDYLGNFKYEWFGPVFTVPMNLAVFYLIFFDRKQ
jgi:hypothetical protein